MKKYLVCLLLCCSPLFAVDFEIDGLKLGVSAKHIALSSPLLTSHSNELMLNDASHQNTFAVGAFSVETMGDYKYQTFSLSKSLKGFSAGFGYSVSGTTGIPRTEEQTFVKKHVQTGVYSFKREHLKFSLNREINERLVFGMGFNHFSVLVDDKKNQGGSLSVGVEINGKNMDVSVSLLNAFLKTKVGEEDLPPNLLMAVRHRGFGKMNIVPSLRYTASELDYESKTLFGVAIEYPLFKSFSLMGSISQHYAGLDVKKSGRFGVVLKLLSMDFSYGFRTVEYSQNSNQHFFSINFKKGRKINGKRSINGSY